MPEAFTLLNKTKGNQLFGRLPFHAMKNKVLGEEYELSLVLVSESEMRRLNRDYHGKDASTNILSFPLSKDAGEIFICPAFAKREAHLFDRTPQKYIGFLFIHGLVHLKGFDHGSTMERKEAKFRTEFGV